jgi:hypothetical protein
MSNLSSEHTPPVQAAPPVRLEAEPQDDMRHAGGSVTDRVLLDGRWIGWIGDRREWCGSHYSGRRWWACWREDGDTAARWTIDLGYRTCASAWSALLEKLAEATDAQRLKLPTDQTGNRASTTIRIVVLGAQR